MQSKPTTPLSRRKRLDDDPWAPNLPRSASLKFRSTTSRQLLSPRESSEEPPFEPLNHRTAAAASLSIRVPNGGLRPRPGGGGGCAGGSKSPAGGEERSPQQENKPKINKSSTPSPPPPQQQTMRKGRNNMTLKLDPVLRPAESASNATSNSNHHSPGLRSPRPAASNHNHRSPSAATPATPPKTPPVTPDSVLNDGDMDSEFSCSSAATSCCWSSTGAVSTSTTNYAPCEHNTFAARNGTTFSGRRNKYVVHCSTYAGQVGNEYLTPTQRAQRHIRRLKELLQQARVDVEHRDSEIMKLTREVVELRLFKASLDRGERSGGSVTSPTTAGGEEKSNSSEAITVRELAEGKTSADVSPIGVDVDHHPLHHHLHGRHHHRLSSGHLTERLLANSSLADSGHFDDLTTTTTTSSSRADGEEVPVEDGDEEKVVVVEDEEVDGVVKRRVKKAEEKSVSDEEERAELVAMYEKRIAELMHEGEARSMDAQREHNEHVEALLNKLSDGQTRYTTLMQDHEVDREEIRQLERKLDELQARLNEEMDEKNKMYLDKFRREFGEGKGDEEEPVAGPSHRRDPPVTASGGRVSMADLVQQLQVTQDELENIKEAKAGTTHDDGAHGQTLLSAKEAISLWLVGARKTMYEKLVDQNRKAARANKVDPEVTLQFLKSAIYYFLTDKENSQGHLAAIESILGFTEEEKQKIDKAMNRKSF